MLSLCCRKLLNYVSELNLRTLDNLNNWQCLLCTEKIDKLIMSQNTILSFSEPNICLIGFLGDFKIKYNKNFNIIGKNYNLKELIRHQERHFTCAVSDFGSWYYIDDLSKISYNLRI